MSLRQQHPSSRHLLPLVAGGVGAAVGQSVTCPLDVVQTRLQSTHLKFHTCNVVGVGNIANVYVQKQVCFNRLISYLQHMIKTEGIKSLFKGLSPGLCGIVPAKAVYFGCYANTKGYLSQVTKHGNYFVHTLSAIVAGSVAATLTNPFWYLKTQLQLNQEYRSIYDIFKAGYKAHGIKSFFRGLSASYVGVSEVVIYFLLYEEFKSRLNLNTKRSSSQTFQPTTLVLSALLSKMAATSLTYPHEVARTRLRQDEKDNQGRIKYRKFIQTLSTVVKEEGWIGLYGGFGTGLIRQLPNTAAVFLTYEAIIYVADRDN